MIKEMKKLLLSIVAATMLFSCTEVKEESILRIHEGAYAFCGASLASLAMKGEGSLGKFNVNDNFQTPDGTDSTVWSFFWYFDSSDTIPQFNPETKEWEWMAPNNRSFIINMDSAATSESNMFAMPGVIFDTTSTGIVLAKVYGPLNEAAIPLRKAVPVKDGQTSITAAKEGAPYPVGTPIPVGGDTAQCCSKEK
jgi:hypothetical protein